jgi:hypothetical protein
MFQPVLALVAIYAIFDRVGEVVPALGLDSHWSVALVYSGLLAQYVWLIKGLISSGCGLLAKVAFKSRSATAGSGSEYRSRGTPADGLLVDLTWDSRYLAGSVKLSVRNSKVSALGRAESSNQPMIMLTCAALEIGMHAQLS